MRNKRFIPDGYKENDKKIKCPECNMILLTFTHKRLEGNLFCFNDKCSVDWFIYEGISKND